MLGNIKITERKKLLLFIMANIFLAVIVFRKFIFGEYLFVYKDANDDTFQAFLPLYQMMVRWMQTGSGSLMNFSTGLGANILQMQQAILDPFAFLLYLVGFLGGEDKIAYALVYVQIIRMMCAAIACRSFLKLFSFSELSQDVAAISYAFSAYTLGDIGQHYYFATAMVFVPLFYLTIEKYRRNVNSKRYLINITILTTICCTWSVYFAYMILLASAIYAIVRFVIASPHKIKELITFFGGLLFGVVLGASISAVIFLPSVLLLIGNSGRVNTGESLFSQIHNMFYLFEFDEYRTMLLRLFSNQIQGTINDWKGYGVAFNAAHLYCSVFAPLGIVQYLIDLFEKKNTRLMNKIAYVVCIGIIVLTIITPIAGTTMNSFVAYQNRYLYVIFPFLAFSLAWFLQKLKNNNWHKNILIIVTMLIIVLICKSANWANNGAMQSVIIAVCCLILFIILAYLNKKRNVLFMAVAILILVNVVLDGRISIEKDRNIVGKGWYVTNYVDQAAHIAINKTNSSGNGFWRFERNFGGWGEQQAFKYSEVEGIRGISVYNSLLSQYFNTFRQNLVGMNNVEPIRAGYSFAGIGMPMDDILADFLGLRYVLSDYKINDSHWRLLQKIHGKYLYQNQCISSAGILYKNWCLEEDYIKYEEQKQKCVLADAVILKDYDGENINNYNFIEGNLQKYTIPLNDVVIENSLVENEKNSVIEIKPSEENTLNIFLNDTTDIEQQWIYIHVYSDDTATFNIAYDMGEGDISVNWACSSQIYYPNENECIVFQVPVGTKAIKVKINNNKILTIDKIECKTIDECNYNTEGIELKNEKLGGEIEGKVIASESSFLVLPILNEKGWKAYVDGNETKIYNANYAFMALELSQGEHDVMLVYNTPGFKVGMIISIAGMMIFVLYLVWYRKRNHNI